jgi:hypothetical protein
MDKKGYFFVLDAIIGLFIITLGLIMIFSFFKYEPGQEQLDLLAFDVMDFLSSNTISDINNDYAGPGGVLHKDGNITQLDNTLLEQVGEFYYRNVTKNSDFTLNLADLFLSAVTKNTVPEGCGLIVRIENKTVYNGSGPLTPAMNDSIVITPSRGVVFGIYNETEIFGPYSIEVIVWK